MGTAHPSHYYFPRPSILPSLSLPYQSGTAKQSMVTPVLHKEHESFASEEENRENATAGAAPLPSALRWVPPCLRFTPESSITRNTLVESDGDNSVPIEATGLALDNAAMGPIFMASLFLGPALLKLATAAAGCDPAGEANGTTTDDMDITTTCTKTIYGFRPSSLLSNMAVASGILVPLLLPIFGAIVDHTPYRRGVGAFTAIALAIVKGLEIALNRYTWAAITVLQVASGLLYNVHVTITYAYNSELSAVPAVLARYNAYYSMVQYASMLLFLVVVLVLTSALGVKDNDVATARVSQTLTTVTAVVVFPWTWRHFFGPRPATAALPSRHISGDSYSYFDGGQGSHLVVSGFAKVFASTKRLLLQEDPRHRALSWVILSLILAESAMSALATIATTFATQVLHMNGQQIGQLFLVVLIAGLPGTALASYGSPHHAALLCNALFVLVTTAASHHLRGPSHQNLAYMYGAAWGVLMGWLSPVDTTLYISLLTTTADRAEGMGIYMWAVSVLAWLPPLLFSFLNEIGVSQAWGLASLNVFFAGAFLCLLQVDEHAASVTATAGMEMLPTREEDAREHELMEEENIGMVGEVDSRRERLSITASRRHSHSSNLPPMKGSGLLIILCFIASMSTSKAWLPIRVHRNSIQLPFLPTQFAQSNTRRELADGDAKLSDDSAAESSLRIPPGAKGLYAPFAKAAWEAWEATGWFNISTATHDERYAPAKGFPPGSQVRMTIQSVAAVQGMTNIPVAYARFALLETLVAVDPDDTKAARQPNHAGIQVLNAVVIPRVGSALPVWGADFVALPGNKHLLLLDAQPMTDNKQITCITEDFFASWYKEQHDVANVWPWAGDLPPEVQPYVSSQALWTRLTLPDNSGEKNVSSHNRPPTEKIAEQLLPAMKDHLDQYFQMLKERADGVDVENWLRPYLEYRLAKDPARPMLKSLYGDEWTEDTLQSILFPMKLLFPDDHSN